MQASDFTTNTGVRIHLDHPVTFAPQYQMALHLAQLVKATYKLSSQLTHYDLYDAQTAANVVYYVPLFERETYIGRLMVTSTYVKLLFKDQLLTTEKYYYTVENSNIIEGERFYELYDELQKLSDAVHLAEPVPVCEQCKQLTEHLEKLAKSRSEALQTLYTITRELNKLNVARKAVNSLNIYIETFLHREDPEGLHNAKA